MKFHEICAGFEILKMYLTVTMCKLRMLETLRLCLKETHKCGTDENPCRDSNHLLSDHVGVTTSNPVHLAKPSALRNQSEFFSND